MGQHQFPYFGAGLGPAAIQPVYIGGYDSVACYTKKQLIFPSGQTTQSDHSENRISKLQYRETRL